MVPGRIYVGQIVVTITIVIIATWIATQWAASALSHQVDLGQVWFIIGGYPVYSPWRIFEWGFIYEAYTPNVFVYAGLLISWGSAFGASFAFVNSLWKARQNKHATTYG